MSVFQPLQEPNRSLAGRIVDYIRDLVEQGELTPGERLPPERELASQLGVSRPVLREALQTLAALGLVDAQHGRGVFIAGGSLQATAQRLSRSLSSSVSLAGEDRAARIHELFEIRRVLEGAAAEWAAEQATPEQIEEMRAILIRDKELRSSATVNAMLLSELDGRLHALIAASTANRLLVLLMAALLDELAQARSTSLLIPGRIQRSLEQHQALVMAIASHDPSSARACMIEHLNDVEQAILQYMDQPPE